MGKVIGLGYAVIETTRFDEWEAFGGDLLGLQPVPRLDGSLRLRADEKAYRFEVHAGSENKVTALGYEVANEADLAALVEELRAEGYTVADGTAEQRSERGVAALASFPDPDGTLRIDLFCSFLEPEEPFVSPTGARFITGDLGFGHALQLVKDWDAYRRLYVDIFGFRLSDRIELAPGQFATFLHCNARHHTFAFASASPTGPGLIGHLMLEVDDIDVVGRAYDRAQAGAARIKTTYGRHTNDKMISMYVESPSDFGIEYGFGGILIDDATWIPRLYDSPHSWGHERLNHPPREEQGGEPRSLAHA